MLAAYKALGSNHIMQLITLHMVFYFSYLTADMSNQSNFLLSHLSMLLDMVQ